MLRLYPGYFITLEGPEGSGKTSQIPKLVSHFRSLGLTVFSTREPGGTNIGEQIRNIILHDIKNFEMHPRTETLLFQSARAQFVEEVIKPHLNKGEIVISDRFYDSTIAYQGYGHQQNLDEVRSIVRYATGGLVPDLTIFMNIDVETGLSRKQKQGEWTRLDAYEIEFHQRVLKGYLEMVDLDSTRWIEVDARPGIDEVFCNLKRIIEGRLVSNEFIERDSFGHER